METHVCVYQTSVDLVNAGLRSLRARRRRLLALPHNYRSGIAALRDAGAVVVSTETAVFQNDESGGDAGVQDVRSSSLLR